MPQKTDDHFQSLLAACEYLIKKGYKVSESKIYRDKDAGKIELEEDGKSVSFRSAWEYAELYLEKIGVNGGDLSDIQSQKEQASLDLKKTQVAKARFLLEKEQGKFLPRSDFEKELVARGVILETGFRNLFNRRVAEWIALVGGRQEKSAEFLAALCDGLDEQLRSYASTNVFYVVFKDE